MLMIERTQMDLLPPAARALVRDLEANYHDAHHLSQAANERLNNLMKLQAPYIEKQAAGRLREDEAERFKSLEADVALAHSRHRTAALADRSASQAFGAVARWLWQREMQPDALRGKGLEIVDVPLPKPEGDLDDVRRQIEEAKADRVALERAPLDRATLEKAIRVQVATLAAKSKPQMLGLDGRGKFEILLRDAKPLALLAWFDPEGLVKRLMQDIPPSAAGAMSPEQKRAKIAEIDETRLRLERMEEALVRATPGTARRADADVAAMLSVELRPIKAAKTAKAA